MAATSNALENMIEKNLAIQGPKITVSWVPAERGEYKKKITDTMSVIPKDWKEQGVWLKQADKVGKMRADVMKLLLEELQAFRLVNEGRVLFLGLHMQMLWELLAPVMEWKRCHLGAPIGNANEDLLLEAWTKEDNNAGPMLPAIVALEEEDIETAGALPGDLQETNQLAGNSQKQVALVAKLLIVGTLPWGSILVSVLTPASTEVRPSATITEMEEEVVVHARGWKWMQSKKR
ncbi:hypothetical protein DACRYDRAFT_16882 [Dacryopinax primogenitus]|uniref:Uncharacterized protein n=1 Tax=Dacryopinax primogenitus (strain DJM 731) TaxID=1858805 RepID=M5FSI7_DACPD|nr:uncharacterized protein DACRYDRAFT_16882 [Dacryopinax primogenitus]EJU00411.1 hypothetical protein DACRYDRAFT_16882 [Dacryopinax primogenitus]